ncbi:hypothetical protein [Streptomyces sp. NPDC048639]|uniref:hypothetical protein n=1 Tax=Streptomyces sp. NPDC048639 TaxID=3365581 RepID=UPI0037132B47
MRRLAVATVVAMTMGSLTSFVGGVAFADGPNGATATGGSALDGSLNQQNIAQEGRQNSACDVRTTTGRIELTSGRLTGRCTNGDRSFNKFSRVDYKGAQAEGGSSTTDLDQQNVAQRGRQNNACSDSISFTVAVDGGRVASECANKDLSRNKGALVKSGGASAEGASGTEGPFQQNIAQEGRQNNACAISNDGDFDVTGGRETSRCGNADRSGNKHVLVKGGGAHAAGGSGVGFEQQNIAQEGRQNNTCASSVFFAPQPTGGQVDSDCVNKDNSRNKEVLVKGGGADVEGGDGAEFQQGIAQEGRQNNACANVIFPDDPAEVTGGRATTECANKDSSRNKHVLVKQRGASVEGGSAAEDLNQQNIAQEGRQNNACANTNGADEVTLTLTGGSVQQRCKTADHSKNWGTKEIGGGASVEGGSSAVDANQQNIAQEGRQNNACANQNGGEITLTGARGKVDCGTHDRSASVGTTEIGGGADAAGGSSTLDMFQQNTAQQGRQSNNCGSPNNLTLTASGGSSTAQCRAVDTSRNIGSDYR